MLKHAYLIMAHTNFNQLGKLIEILDYKQNDIYIHIDKKSKFNEEELKSHAKVSNIYFVKRVKVTWGSFSQIQAELNLLSEATINNYDYYHLLSGIDMPIKKNAEIQNFFEQNNGKIFLHFRGNKEYKEVIDRVKYYYICTDFRKKKGLEKVIKYIFFHLFLAVQKIFRVNRIKNINGKIRTGANWFSITNDLAQYVVKNKEKIIQQYKMTFCADEVFLQTIVFNNEKFREKLYYSKFDDNYISILRKIEWRDYRPYTWKIQDFDYLMEQKDYLFARKIDEKIDKDLVEKIYKKLIEN